MIKENIKTIKNNLPIGVKLVAVSKTKPIADLRQAYEAGQRVFGENRVQELCQKYETLPKDIQWHMIGHLQRNKVKYIAPFVHLIHTVDSLKLLEEIEKQAKKNNRIISVLLQIKIAQESTKSGLTLQELKEILHSEIFKKMKNISVEGLMGMATLTKNTQQIRSEFKSLKNIFEKFKNEQPHFKRISMGMSTDYPIAVEEGSTLIRVGTAIFGTRNKYT